MNRPTPAPGPWTYHEGNESVHDRQGHMIGRFEPASGSLAAAAPDLLQALERLTHAVQDVAGDEPTESRYGSLWAELRAEAMEAQTVIAKAKGDDS